MATVKVGIIDDGYPVMEAKKLNLQKIEELYSHENWGQEESLRELNISLVSESRIWKEKILLEAFVHPQIFLEEQQFDSDFLIYDWEYKPYTNSYEDLYKILSLTNSKIFIFSAYDTIDNIHRILSDAKFDSYRDSNRYEIKSKGNDEDSDAIIKSIMDKFKAGEKVIWEGLNIEIKPSRHLIDSDDFWKIKSIVGADILMNYVNIVNAVFSEETIEQLFSELKDSYFIDSKKNILSSSESELLKAGYGALQKLTAIEALKAFGIDKLEEAKEKGYTKIK